MSFKLSRVNQCVTLIESELRVMKSCDSLAAGDPFRLRASKQAENVMGTPDVGFQFGFQSFFCEKLITRA